MFNRKATLLIFIILSVLTLTLKAGDTISVSHLLKREMSDRTIRLPEKGYIESFRNQKDYQYGEDIDLKQKNNFFSRLWQRIVTIINYAIEAYRNLHLVIQIVFFSLCLLILFVIITKTKLYKVFYTDKEIPGPDFFTVNPLDDQYDYDKAISEQISIQNFRKAIRLLHLRILKELENQGIIRFSKGKTNREFAQDITDKNLKDIFFELALIYNRVWFGNYNLGIEEFESLASKFYLFSAKINAKKE